MRGMKTGLGCLLLCGAVLAQGGLEGRISGGKAKRLRDEGLALVKQANAVWKRWVLEEIAAGKLEEELSKAIELYDRGCARLNAAVEIQNDSGVNHSLRLAAQKLAEMRARLLWLEEQRVLRERPRPTPQPGTRPEPGPAPTPHPSTSPSPRPPRPSAQEPPAPKVEVVAGEPPAHPVDVALRAASRRSRDGRDKRDEKAIRALLSGYYGAQRKGKLLARHKLCSGKGVLRGGAICEECAGTGKQINLFYFRKVYWNAFTPLLRDAAGALEALRAFHERARKDPALLGPEVKSFKVVSLELHGLWARAAVEVRTSAVARTVTLTLVSIGSAWYLYTPATDAELLSQRG